MKFLVTTSLFFLSLSSSAQYYYKDIIGTKETADLMRTYRTQKVNRVELTSFDANNTRNNDFYVEQQFSSVTQTLKTITRSDVTNESVLTSFVDATGHVIKTIDSSEAVVSTSVYNYNNTGQLVSVIITSVDSFKTANETEQHLWQYGDNNVARMLRIKNTKDTTYVDFKIENGNIVEEQQTHKGIKTEPFLYYYDANNRLTDIVRYSKKAKRLLPQYMFEYSDNSQVIQKITVPENSDDYLIWRYQYNSKGLKTKEVIYNKQKKLTGKIEYQYSFNS